MKMAGILPVVAGRRQCRREKDKEVPEMFQPGDLVVYGSSGVCRVIQVGTLEGKPADPSREYYTLQPMFEAERIYTPVDSGVFMRPAMTKEQARDLIRQIPFIQEDLCTERNPTNLRIHYEASLQSHKYRETVRKGRKMGQVDQRYRKKAEGLLHGELSIALGIPLDQVEGYIQQNMQEEAG